MLKVVLVSILVVLITNCERFLRLLSSANDRTGIRPMGLLGSKLSLILRMQLSSKLPHMAFSSTLC